MNASIKYIAFLCAYLCCTPLLYAQLFSTATQKTESRYKYVTYSDLCGRDFVSHISNPWLQTALPYTIPCHYTPCVWHGTIQDIGATFPSSIPAIRRASNGFPLQESGEPHVKKGAISDIPWLFLLLCASGYFLRKEQKLRM